MIPVEPGRLPSDVVQARSDELGRFSVELDVVQGVTAFQMTMESDAEVAIDRLIGPSGDVALRWQDWVGDQLLTNAVFVGSSTVAFNWPVREIDGPLQAGTWRAEWLTVDDDRIAPLQDVDVRFHQKADIDPRRGTVAVEVLYAQGVGQRDDVVAAVDDAIVHWRTIWDQAGLEMRVTTRESDLDPLAPWVFRGDQSLAEVGQDKEPGAIQLVIADQLIPDETSALPGAPLGISGGIPGSVAATPKSFVAVSWMAHAGVDGLFSGDEMQLFGETMAHEVGHYMGLYHPVESNFRQFDALDDTVACTDAEECESQLSGNLMFPYAICGPASCVAARDLTDDQQAVLHHHLSAL